MYVPHDSNVYTWIHEKKGYWRQKNGLNRNVKEAHVEELFIYPINVCNIHQKSICAPTLNASVGYTRVTHDISSPSGLVGLKVVCKYLNGRHKSWLQGSGITIYKGMYTNVPVNAPKKKNIICK